MKLKDFHCIHTAISPTSNAETLLAEMKNISGKYDMTLPYFYIVSMVYDQHEN